MEPINNNKEINEQDSLNQNTESVYHTVSGRPETLAEVKTKEPQNVQFVISAEEKMVNNTEPNVSTLTHLEGNEDNSSNVPSVESNVFLRFFDNHPRWGTFFFLTISNIFLGVFTNFLLYFGNSIGSALVPFISILGVIPFLIVVYFAIINYRNKRKDILMTLVTLIVFSTVVFLIGFGLCLVMIGAIKL